MAETFKFHTEEQEKEISEIMESQACQPFENPYGINREDKEPTSNRAMQVVSLVIYMIGVAVGILWVAPKIFG